MDISFLIDPDLHSPEPQPIDARFQALNGDDARSTEGDSVVPTETAKRGRGRPRGVTKPAQSKVPGRGRGRPRKNAIEIVQEHGSELLTDLVNDDAMEEALVNVEGEGGGSETRRRKKSLVAATGSPLPISGINEVEGERDIDALLGMATVVDEDAREALQRRGRGRPKGSVKRRAEEPAAEEVGGERPVKRARGRPRKDGGTPAMFDATPKPTGNLHVRLRGRPRKHVDAEEEAVAKKRGRGRPKKIDALKPNAISKSGRPRGRPRKAEAAITPASTGKKRGRPRKTVDLTKDDTSRPRVKTNDSPPIFKLKSAIGSYSIECEALSSTHEDIRKMTLDIYGPVKQQVGPPIVDTIEGFLQMGIMDGDMEISFGTFHDRPGYPPLTPIEQIITDDYDDEDVVQTGEKTPVPRGKQKPYRLYFRMCGRDADDAAQVRQSQGYMEFTDKACKEFTGYIFLPPIGINTMFGGRRVSKKPATRPELVSI